MQPDYCAAVHANCNGAPSQCGIGASITETEVYMLQVECSVLPQLGAKKQGTDRGALGPITVQVPLSICLQDSLSGPDPTSASHMDGQAALGAGAGGSSGPALPILTANGTHVSEPLPIRAAPEGTVHAKQASVRGSRGGSRNRRKRAAEEIAEAGTAEQAGASEAGRASKQHKPDLSLLQDDLLRWVLKQNYPLSFFFTNHCQL